MVKDMGKIGNSSVVTADYEFIRESMSDISFLVSIQKHHRDINNFFVASIMALVSITMISAALLSMLLWDMIIL